MQIDFNKNSDGLVPAIIQDATTKNVLMLGYMNQEAVTKTKETQQEKSMHAASARDQFWWKKDAPRSSEM